MKLNLINIEPMQKQILIFLNEAQPAWLILDAAGIPLQCIPQGDLSKLQTDPQAEIGVILPAQDVLLTEAKLPRLNSYRLQQALPFALEEQVLDEVELLHFAPGPYQMVKAGATEETTPCLPVAIVKKALLEQWLAHLEAHGIQPDWLTSAVFALPSIEGQWQACIQGNTAVVRTGPYTGFSVDRPNLQTLLTLKLAEAGQAPEKLVISHDKKHACSFSYSALPLEIVALSSQEALQQAAAALRQNTPLNLLQGPYASKRKLRIPAKNKRAWRLAANAFALWLGLLFLSKIGSLLILSFEHHHLQSLIKEIYQAHFPQATAVVEPKRRLEAKLKKALAESEKNRFFQWLGALAKTSPAVRIQNLNFQNNQLSLELITSSFTALDEFTLALKMQGVEVKQQSATLSDTQVKAVLLIESKPT